MADFEAKKRKILGKKVKALRQKGYVPAVLSEKGQASVPLVLRKENFLEVYSEVGQSSLAYLNLDSQRFKVVVSGVSRSPITDDILHVDFQKIHTGEVITASIPIKIIGESPAVKKGKGMLLTVVSELEIECLPKDLPSEVVVDVSNLKEIDDAVTVGDLPLDFEKVKVLDHVPEDPVVKIEEAEMEEVEEVGEVPIGEVEVTEEKGEEEAEEAEDVEKEGAGG